MSDEDILKLFNDCNFKNLTADNYEDLIIDHLPKDLEFDYSHGVSKMCITLENENFVIKIPFSGQEIPIEEYDAETNTYFDTDDTEYVCFTSADDDNLGADYCKAEALRYKKAVAAGVEQLFAETRLVGYVNNYPIYIQPLCKIYCVIKENKKCYSKQQKETISKICKDKDYYCFCDEFLLDVLYYYGQEIFDKFMRFIEEAQIEDLHYGNIGYINDQPVVFDYASYYD